MVNSQRSMVNSQRWRGQMIVMVLMGIAIAWRVNASLPQADSRHREEDVALDRAALLLDQRLPEGIALFAAVDDALALQYLRAIWGIRSDVVVVSSPQAAERLARGEPVLATTDAATTLSAELPPALAIAVQSGGAEWVEFATVASSPSRRVGDMRSAPESGILTAEGIALRGYQFARGPTGAPVHMKADATRDLTLFWEIAADGWPDGLSISVRPIQNGAFIPDVADSAGGIIQHDVAAPVQGLLTLGAVIPQRLTADAYRVPWPDGADGVMVILYRVTDSGFANVAEIRLGIE